MARIVGVFGTAHIVMSPEGVEEKAAQVFDGMVDVGRRVRSTRPTILVVISGDHMFNINQDYQIPICVGVADEWIPQGEMNTGTRPFPGHRKLAEGFVDLAAERGFDIAKSEALRPDHGVSLPLRFISPKNNIPVVPILLNINMTPLLQPGRCYALGSVLKDTIESMLPPGERVAVIGTGGISHWLFVPRMGEVNQEFDRTFLRKMAEGKAEEVSRMSAAEVVEASGNGGLEIIAWLMAAATMPGAQGEQVYYVPVEKWGCGMGGLAIVA
jgi:2'-aminobiphenyl-2,3-diol 1,2-dioxygenase, large subunit